MPDLGAAPVALGVQVPQQQPLMNQLLPMLQAQGQMQQNRLVNQQFQANQAMGQIFANSGNPEEAIAKITQSPWAPFAGQAIGAFRQAAYTKMQMDQLAQETQGKALAGFMQGLPVGLADPSQIKPWKDSYLATLPASQRSVVEGPINNYLTSLTKDLPSDPAQARALFNQRIIGQAVSLGTMDSGKVNAILGTPGSQDLGGRIQPTVQMPSQLGGGILPAGAAMEKSLAPQLAPVGPGGAQTIVTQGQGQGAGAGGNQLGVPPAPGPQGLGPDLTQKEYLTSRGKDMADYQKNLDQTVTAGSQIMQVVSEARDALKSITPGGGAPAREALGRIAQMFNLDPALTDKIANGNLGASQELNKLMVNGVMSQIKTQMPAGSRTTDNEFRTFQANNPNLETDPRAMEKIFNFWTKLYTRAQDEQSGLNEYMDKPGSSISKWPSIWQKQAQEKGYIEQKLTNEEGDYKPKVRGPARPPLDSFITK